ncbi:MAG TPA: hypothetical protein VLZ05_30070 [Mycobacterium sp.]|nr:hypothetical protein [Mycobacterium sp.]
MIRSFTHDIPTPTSLAGVAPTGRAVMLPAYEPIYWDQACLLVVVGLLDKALLPVTGVDQARTVLDKGLPANTLLKADQPGVPA